jgi:archaemetzincin
VEDTLYLVPVGDVQGAILHPLCAGVEEVLGIPSQVAPALPHPSYAYSMERDQYLSASILEQLAQADQQNTFRVLGVVDLDLYVPQLNFVFGQAATGGRKRWWRCHAFVRASTACQRTSDSSTTEH